MSGIILIPILISILVLKNIRIRVWHYFNKKTKLYNVIPDNKIDQLFTACVNYLVIVANYIGMTYNEINISSYPDLTAYVLSAKKTATGNYVVETKGAGYGIKGGDDYHPASGKYIEIRICLSAQGKIIDVVTTFQEESKGIGDACANEKFYGQFEGKTQADYKEIDAISGATVTTNAYLKAIERAFESLQILEGGSANEE